jgi:hypothetical protein
VIQGFIQGQEQDEQLFIDEGLSEQAGRARRVARMNPVISTKG